MRQAQIGYYACITHLDHQIGRLILALVEQELYDDCIFLFTSDHGEELCDHHMFRKSRPYEGSCHIPLLISAGANVLPGFKARGNLPHGRGTARRDADAPRCRGRADPRLARRQEPFAAYLRPVRQRAGMAARRTQLRGIFKPLDCHFARTNSSGTAQAAASSIFDLADDPHELHDRILDPACKARIRRAARASDRSAHPAGRKALRTAPG